ncbi:MAG: MFS transporter [Arachnia sp.]
MVSGGAWKGYERGSSGYRRILLALLCAGIATFAQLYSLQGVLPIMASDLRINAAQASLTVSTATLGLAVAVIPWSLVSDRFGRRRTMVAAVVSATVLGMTMSAMPTFESLVAMRFVEGMALGGIPSVAMAYLAEEVHPLHTAIAGGSYISGTTLGGLSGRIVAAPVGDFFGWRAGILMVSLLAAAAATVFIVLSPRQQGFTPEPLRITGQEGLVHRRPGRGTTLGADTRPASPGRREVDNPFSARPGCGVQGGKTPQRFPGGSVTIPVTVPQKESVVGIVSRLVRIRTDEMFYLRDINGSLV